MFDQLPELEIITTQLECITSLLNMMCEIYFDKTKPNVDDLKLGYTDCKNVINTIRDMVIGQRDNLDDITDKLYKVYYELKRLSEQSIAVLEGGVSND